MANTIVHKRSSTGGAVPAGGSLTPGELAVNTANGRVFTKRDDGTVVDVGWTPRIGSTTATSSSASISWDLYDIIRLTLQANVTTFSISGAADGQRCMLEVIQDSTGGRTINWPSNIRFGTDITSITLTSTANKKDRIGLIYDSAAGKYDVVAIVKGF